MCLGRRRRRTVPRLARARPAAATAATAPTPTTTRRPGREYSVLY